MIRTRYWMYFLPGAVYAYGPVAATSEREAREKVRRAHGFTRLPRGTAVWRTGR
jgi:hypothetical protein